ncbi:MAG: hypothetical protein ABIZ34_04045 [Candidatus Limnocylindrales bacterium]
MTIICRDHQLLFLENRNTGSTAIRAVLRERLGGEQLLTEPVRAPDGKIVVPWRHATLGQLLAAGVVSALDRKEMTVVSGVRNPFDLAVTEYARLRGKQARAAGNAVALAPVDFERFVRRRYSPGLVHRLAGRHGRVPPDFAADADHVIRFERMQEDLDALMRRIGIDGPVEIPQRNVTRARSGRDFREMYTPAARAIVERAYSSQLKRYGYSFTG